MSTFFDLMYLLPDWKQFLLKIDLQGRLHEYCKWLKILSNFQFSSFWSPKKEKGKNCKKNIEKKLSSQNDFSDRGSKNGKKKRRISLRFKKEKKERKKERRKKEKRKKGREKVRKTDRQKARTKIAKLTKGCRITRKNIQPLWLGGRASASHSV